MLLCNDPSRGFIIAYCKKCNKEFVTHLSCNSRICTRCGTKYLKQWIERVVERMYSVDYSHIVFTMPMVLWKLIEGNWKCISELYRLPFDILRKTMSERAHQAIKPGVIAAGHTFGKDLKFNVHFHTVCTDGGFTRSGLWKSAYFLPYRLLMMRWRDAVLGIIRKHCGSDMHAQIILAAMYHDYPHGFRVWRIKGRMAKKELVRYIARYIRHPAIADRRIVKYERTNVTIDCKDTQRMISWHETFSVDEFIGRLVKHIPPKGFPVVRQYGLYAKKVYVQRKVKQDKQETIFPTHGAKQHLKCPVCGGMAEIVFSYFAKRGGKPPPDGVFGVKITDWVS